MISTLEISNSTIVLDAAFAVSICFALFPGKEVSMGREDSSIPAGKLPEVLKGLQIPVLRLM